MLTSVWIVSSSNKAGAIRENLLYWHSGTHCTHTHNPAGTRHSPTELKCMWWIERRANGDRERMSAKGSTCKRKGKADAWKWEKEAKWGKGEEMAGERKSWDWNQNGGKGRVSREAGETGIYTAQKDEQRTYVEQQVLYEQNMAQ